MAQVQREACKTGHLFKNARKYWLLETKSPSHRSHTNADQRLSHTVANGLQQGHQRRCIALLRMMLDTSDANHLQCS